MPGMFNLCRCLPPWRYTHAAARVELLKHAPLMKYDVFSFSSDLLTNLSLFMNTNHNLDHFTPTLLKEKIFKDPDYDEGLVISAGLDGGFYGFAMTVLRTNGLGFIKLIAVKEETRLKGLGTTLYGILESRLKAKGCKTVRVYNSAPNYFLPGVDVRYTPAVCFFEKLGFRKYSETYNMVVELSDGVFQADYDDTNSKTPGFQVRRVSEGTKEKFLDFMHVYFPGWQYEASNMLTGEEITAFIGLKGDEIAGFSGYDGNNLGTGWFGPIGVRDDYRGMGLGSILLKVCLNDMKKHYTKAVIP
ncbi:MAG: GNAT family N-acetyltransferase, partial [Spirochaetota bacterium]